MQWAAVKRAHGDPRPRCVALNFPSCAVGKGQAVSLGPCSLLFPIRGSSISECLPAPPGGDTGGPWFGPRLPKLQDALCFAGGETEAVGTKGLKRGWMRTQASSSPDKGIRPSLHRSLLTRMEGTGAPSPCRPSAVCLPGAPLRGEHCWGPKGTAVLMPSPSSSEEAQCPQGQPVTGSSLWIHEVQNVSETKRQQRLEYTSPPTLAASAVEALGGGRYHLFITEHLGSRAELLPRAPSTSCHLPGPSPSPGLLLSASASSV